ncbi:ABC transporter permease [Garciella nitratireducens]|uniref:Oligopeptide transport system permease protein n=1 Tax=Garciella nitratireducens DSM 15102 TaxID=1121911 RepID=A0A1T4NAU0_9FIRM|nr:ABC transporter permease [Garciella nitratireducens]RBP37243.1 oligopeptide transport system permease protein [Garciella nitratireducens]SJZ76389.1 oligopeptide transport system permease protein [Garciella nitratireducens DSM 15102]
MNSTLTEQDFERVGKNLEESQAIVRPSLTYWQDAWRRLKKNKLAMISLVILIGIVFMCIFGPYMVPYKYYEQNYTKTNLSPGQEGHIFGTDSLGRDLFSRVWYGGRVSIFIGVVVALIALVVGVVYGGIAGYMGGKVDNIMMRIVDVLLTIPGMLLNILLLIVLEPGIVTLIIAFGLTGWLSMARLVRGQILQLKEQEFVLAARALGADTKRIIFKHLIPNILGPIIVEMTLTIPSAIFSEAFLSYIGLGIRPPGASWGVLANEGTKVLRFYPYELIIPAIFISLTILAFNLFGDGLRDALDPKLRD